MMLTVVIAGSGKIAGRPEESVVRGGMVGLVFGHEEGILMSDPKDPYLHYYSRFRGEYARELALKIRANRATTFFAVRDVLALGDRLHRHIHISRFALPSRCGPEGLEILSILEGLAGPAVGDASDATTRPFEVRLRDYLFEHVSAPTLLNSIAADLGFSRATLTRAARAATGMSVQQLHEEIKMSWAATLLNSTSGSVAEIGRRVGFQDQFYFSRVFRRHHGCSPRGFARRA